MIQTPSSATPRIYGAMRAMPAPSSTPVQILLVEDSPDDADLMIGALKEGRLDVRVSLVEDGESALAFLHREAPPGVPRPDLILLDLYLPRKGGHEVLAELKQDPDLRQIPVVILTSSDSEQAFLDAYNLHANCCVSKPVDQAEYAQVVHKIENFWLAVAQRVRRT